MRNFIEYQKDETALDHDCNFVDFVANNSTNPFEFKTKMREKR